MCSTFVTLLPPVTIAFMFVGFVAHAMALLLAGEYVQRNFPLADRVMHTLLPWRVVSYVFALFQPNAYGLLLEARRIRIAAYVRAWWIMLAPFLFLIFVAAYHCNLRQPLRV